MTTALIIIAVLAIAVPCVILYRGLRRMRVARGTPSTPAHLLTAPTFATQQAVSTLRLSSSGRVAMAFLLAFGLLAILITAATWHMLREEHRYHNAPTALARLIPSDRPGSGSRYEFEVEGRPYQGWTRLKLTHRGLTIQYLNSDPSYNRPLQPPPPLVIGLWPAALLDGLTLWLLRKMWRDHLLAKRGRLASGLVVAFGLGQRQVLGQLIPVVYDFLSSDGEVTRGTTLVSIYSKASPYFLTSVGSKVEVLYLPQNPRHNGLKLSLFWRA